MESSSSWRDPWRHGSGQTNLTNNPSYDRLYDNNNVNPVITPDGKNIVYNSDMDIYIMGIDGNNPRNLTNSSGNDFYQQVSPDGNYIVFQSSRNGNTEVYIMGIDGNNIKNISNGFGYYPTIDNKSDILKSMRPPE